MNQVSTNYVVSSAGWEMPVDHSDPYGAALGGVVSALNKYGQSTEMSTVVMVTKDRDHKLKSISNSQFFPSHRIFKDLGCDKTSKGFKEFCNASQRIK
tara:strand:+ start:965 stop:1258 length:294 start_codon:yes stop_codon:yes gene_type:complete